MRRVLFLIVFALTACASVPAEVPATPTEPAACQDQLDADRVSEVVGQMQSDFLQLEMENDALRAKLKRANDQLQNMKDRMQT